MLAAVKGHYDGNHIVINEEVKLNAEQEVIADINYAGKVEQILRIS